MEHLITLAAAAADADKAYSEAHAARYAATDPAEQVRLDIIKRQALNAHVDAKIAYERALDAHLDDLTSERRRAGFGIAAE